MTEEKKEVTPQELIATLEGIDPKEEPKQKVRLNHNTLTILHEEVGSDKLLEYVGKISLYSDRKGFDFIKILTLRKELSGK